jgi:ABC-type nitrate/sulfonate/bicarbonate transport system substrate-binding protein
VTTRDFAGSDRDVLVKFIRAIARGQELARTDVDATMEELLNAGIPDLDRELVEAIVAIYTNAIPESPAVSVTGVERSAELFPAHLAPPDLSGIDLSLYVDTSVWEEAR